MKNSFRVGLTVILFFLFEYISLSLYFNRDQNNYAKSINAITYINELLDNVTDYTKLTYYNKKLSDTNAELEAKLSEQQQLIEKYKEQLIVLPDSLINTVFSVGAKIINQTILKKDNIIRLNKGRRDGVERGMTVIANGAIVGHVIYVSRYYSTVRSILSEKIKTSGSLKKNNSIVCSIWWGGDSPYKLNFAEMSKYSDVKIGDTIITTSFSMIFPQNINIGVISKIDFVQDKYYDGEIDLFNDFKKMDYLSIISNTMKKIDTTTNFVQ